MKSITCLIAALLAVAETLHAQETLPPASETIESTSAQIIGPIPDGTPPLPAPPEPEFSVSPEDILSTTTHQQDGRTITIREIKPIDLPSPDSGADVPSASPSPEFKERIAEYQATHPRAETVTLGATIYRSKSSPPRTLVHYWPGNGHESITFWSSADFSLISGIHSFSDTDGKPRTLFMTWSAIDTDRMASLTATRRVPYQAPEIPALPEGKATYQIVGKAPAAEDLIPIQSLHDLYNSDYDRLLAAYQGREQARLAREAELKANPPKPQDITLDYWRTEAPAKGGAR